MEHTADMFYPSPGCTFKDHSKLRGRFRVVFIQFGSLKSRIPIAHKEADVSRRFRGFGATTSLKKEINK